MEKADKKVHTDLDDYQRQLYNFIPINAKLIGHVRRIDGFNETDLIELKSLLTETARNIDSKFSFKNTALLADKDFRKFLEIVMKVHQIFALVDVEFGHVFPSVSLDIRQNNIMTHFQEIAEELSEHNGLNYTPREQNEDGRLFEHASDCKVLIDHLVNLENKQSMSGEMKNLGESPESEPIPKVAGNITYYVHVENDPTGAKEELTTAVSQIQTKNFDQILTDLKITKKDHIVLSINSKFIDLVLKANGKADLYFHAYLWEQYLKNLDAAQNTIIAQKAKKVAGAKTAAAADAEEDEIIEIFSDKYHFMKRLQGLSMTLTKVIVNIKKFPFSEKMYKKYVNEFGRKQLSKKMKYLEEIQRSLFVAQIADDKEGLYWIEKLLIQLQGYPDMSIRDQAIVLLNMLYDGVDWQLLEAFRPSIRCVGQHFVISCVVHKSQKQDNSQIFLGLGAPSPIEGNNFHLLTWHKLHKRNIIKEDNIMYEININFGKFWKCGFYDWRLVSISDEGKLTPLEIIGKPDPVFPVADSYQDDYSDEDQMESDVGSIAQGRFIVHARGLRDRSFHEVQIDYQNARIDKEENTFIQRGSFRDVEQSIPQYAMQGINTLYLMGTLERDNYPFNNKYNDRIEYRKDDASAQASIDRSMPNKMLGGEQGLRGIMRAAKQNRVKIIVDSLARISSSRHNRKYDKHLLHYLDEDGRRHICYGTDGQQQKFEDTAMLNYRQMESWELLIDEIVTYTQKFGIDGIHLDNGQAWPQIMEPDTEELQRIDVDGEPAYTPEDFMNGTVVIRNENHGYWNSNNMETYPNPFFIKMCKKLWNLNPEMMIIGECWGGLNMEHRQIILSRSGVVPRLFKLPIALSSIMGKKLNRDGSVLPCEKQTVTALKHWQDDCKKFLPEGTILMQSSTSHALPYPAYLYGQGTWAAIDTLFFMPDLPITFMGELDGDVFRVGQIQTVFQQEQQQVQSSGNELKRTNSQIMMAMNDMKDSDENLADGETEPFGKNVQKKGLPKVRSGLNLAANYVEAQEGKIEQKEQNFRQSMGPDKGFDLSMINTHYAHRRKLRKEKMVLRYGECIFLTGKDAQNQYLSEILSYARYSLQETIIIATNMSVKTQKFIIDMQNLLPTFTKAYPNNTVVMVKNVINNQGDPEYYFLREFIESRSIRTLPAFRSLMISVTICQDDQFIFKKCLTNSIDRTKVNLQANKSIEQEQISLLFSDCVMNNPSDIARFANVIGSLQHSFLDKLNVSFRNLFVHNSKLANSVEMSSRLIAMTGYILKQARGTINPPTRAAQSMFESNQLGPIFFFTPELGKYSTVGGLGVMVDELSVGIAELGQDVYVISPYYERNRKGLTGYLKTMGDGIEYVDNIEVDIDGGVTLGVHEAKVKGVNLVFLHNADIFPSPYPDVKPDFAVKQIAVFDKACLEYCCKRQIIPAIGVTNDWFTGFVAAYAKVGCFDDTFKGTQFVHICHNLQEAYEGRIYLDHKHGTLQGLHKLPNEWLIDPQWQKVMINPSRCAVMMSDQWATVSRSYRDDLLNESSLASLLKQKKQPFAFPNGIPIEERVRRLDKAAPDHMTAKGMLQKKYFNFESLDDSVPLFAFVGRVTSQKGVHLILDVAEHIFKRFDYKIQFLVGGPANMKEPYSAGCAHKMWHLRNKYPNCFWAAPEEFFTDGALVNRGTDFGLMPSVFEPGGIVQHEFFVGGTPVIAHKTGGLKDSVIEFQWDSETGCGYTFQSHTTDDFIFAIERAMGTYKNKPKYLKLRENAFKATTDGEVVCKAWLGEFYRLCDKKMIDYRIVKDLESQFQHWQVQDYLPISIIQEIFGSDKKQQIFQEIDNGAADDDNQERDGFVGEIDNVISAFDQLSFNKVPHQFQFQNRGPRHGKVQLCGSFDTWQVRHDMSFDPFTNQWFITLHIKSGEEYEYKYIINDTNWVISDEEPKKDDGTGNINNICGVAI